MKLTPVLTLLALPFVTFSQSNGPLRKNQIKSIVTFGDSYTDIVSVGDEGTAWPVYVSGYAGVKLLPYAKSGATCSNNITFRPFPPVMESQVPAFIADKQSGAVRVDGGSALYTLWIGTNDVGIFSLISGDNSASIVDVAGCMADWVQVMYDNGARNFLFQNVSPFHFISTRGKLTKNQQMIPLDLVPLYSANSWPNKFWHFQRNTTEWSILMRELVLSGNALTKLMLQDLAPKLHDAHIGQYIKIPLLTLG